MKKIALLFFALASLQLHALPVGNPAEASLLHYGLYFPPCCRPTFRIWDDFNYRGGFYGDYVKTSSLHVNDKNLVEKPYLEHTSLNTNAAYAVVNLWDRFDIFGTLGQTKINLLGNAKIFHSTTFLSIGQRFFLETDSDFSWSVGLRGTVWRLCGFAFGIEGQFFSTRPQVKRIGFTKGLGAYLSDTHPRLRAEYNEFQVGFGAAYRIEAFVPYAAFKWSNVDLFWIHNPNAIDVSDGKQIHLHDLNAGKNAAGAIGVSWIGSEQSMITLEGRFGNETAFYVNAQIRI